MRHQAMIAFHRRAGIAGIGKALIRFRNPVDRIGGEQHLPPIRQRQQRRQMPRRMAGRRDQGDPVAELCLLGEGPIARLGPSHRLHSAEITRPRVRAFGRGQDDLGMGEEGQASYMVNMAMAQDHMGDIRRR
jgi:hypothetical protein